MVFLKAKVFLLKQKEVDGRLEFYDYFHNPQTKYFTLRNKKMVGLINGLLSW